MTFFRTLLTSILGTFLALFLFGFIAIIILISIASSANKVDTAEPYIRDNTVLEIDFRDGLIERLTPNPFAELFNQKQPSVSLEMLRNNLPKAAKDDRIAGLVLRVNFLSGNWASINEAYTLIKNFKEQSGKFVYAYTDDIGMNEAAYFAIAAADSIFTPHESFFEFDGFYIETEYYKGLFDKVGIEAEISRFGKYKSAIEPYIQKKLSDASRYQLQELQTDFTDLFLNAVTYKTGKSKEEINALLNSVPDPTPAFALKNGLIDGLKYPTEFDAFISEKTGKQDNYRSVSLKSYYNVKKITHPRYSNSSDNKIAVIHLSGEILPVEPSELMPNSVITATKTNKIIRDLINDDDIKAIVVRINSPGGSGTTSDLIWHQLRGASKVKPVVASMGAVAASGGYYIAAGADTIVAEAATITGSIGVFGSKFNISTLMNDNLGITFDVVKSHNYADWFSPTRSFSKSELSAFQKLIDDFYDTFLSRVAETRNMSKEEIHEVAQGRVWSGMDAVDINLVDLIGSLDDAITIASEMAGLSWDEPIEITNYPKPQTFLESLLMSSGSTISNLIRKNTLPGSETYFDILEKLQPHKKLEIHTLMPVTFNFK